MAQQSPAPPPHTRTHAHTSGVLLPAAVPPSADVLLAGNSAPAGKGGGLALEGGSFALFRRVSVRRNQAGQGGGAAVRHSTLSSDSNAPLQLGGSLVWWRLKGGLLRLPEGTSLGDEGCVCRNNATMLAPSDATEGGGGLGSGGGLLLQGQVAVRGLNVSRNSAASAGGGVWSVASVCVMNDTLVGRNVAGQGGGGLSSGGSGGSLTLSSVTIRQNDGGSTGGGLLLTKGSTCKLLHSVVMLNVARDGGGGVYVEDASLYAFSVKFSSNAAQVGKQCILASPLSKQCSSPSSVPVDVPCCPQLHACPLLLVTPLAPRTTRFRHQMYGGAIFATRCTVELRQCAITGNAAQYAGGGLYVERGSELTFLNGSVLADNSASYEGGGVYVVGSTLRARHLTVEGNRGLSGGGLYAASAAQLHMQHCKFSGNAARDNGGAAFLGRNSHRQGYTPSCAPPCGLRCAAPDGLWSGVE